MQNALN